VAIRARAKRAARRTVTINRAPVLTLWAAVVAERLGFRRDEALTFGRAVAGLNAYAKGKSLGIFKPKPKGKFGDALAAARAAMMHLARAFPAEALAERGCAPYEAFRPEIPAVTRGWGATGALDLARTAALAR